MEDVSRYVNIGFIFTALLLSWVLMQTAEVALASFGPGTDMVLFAGIQSSALLGVALAVGIVGYYYWATPRAYELATEVAVELSKVSWPDAEDTKRHTYIVVWFAIIVSVMMSVFDFVWKLSTDALLSLPH